MHKTKEFTILPAAPGTCPECATAHDPTEPHNQTSLFYQIKFINEHRHSPTWVDAMEHCCPEMQAAWVNELAAMGVVFPQQKEEQK